MIKIRNIGKEWKRVGENSLFAAPRTASTALFNAILEKYYPLENQEKIKNNDQPHKYVPAGNEPIGKAYIFMREPLDRFKSVCARLGLTAEQGIVKASEVSDIHFAPVVSFIEGHLNDDFKFYKFPDDINLLAQDLGLDTPIEQENASLESQKITLTPEQENAVKEIYKEDINFFNKNTE